MKAQFDDLGLKKLKNMAEPLQGVPCPNAWRRTASARIARQAFNRRASLHQYEFGHPSTTISWTG